MAEDKPTPTGDEKPVILIAGRGGHEVGRHTVEPEKPPEAPRKLSFGEIQATLINDPTLSIKERGDLLRERALIVREVVGRNGGQDARNIRFRVLQEIRGNDWDHVYGRVADLGPSLESQYQGFAEADPRHAGVIDAAVNGVANMIVINGIERKKEDPPEDFNLDTWLGQHHYGPRDVEEIEMLADLNEGVARAFGFPEHPEEMVGDDLRETVATPTEVPAPADFSKLDKLAEAIERAREDEGEYRTLMLRYQEAQLELMKKGLKGFVQGIVARAHINPEQYDQSLPPWFEELGEREQGIFRNMLHINYLAAIKRDTGMVDLDTWAKVNTLRIEKRAFNDMIRTFPGARWALASMMHHIFDLRGQPGRGVEATHLVISGDPERKTEGYAITISEERLNEYMETLTDAIAARLEHDDRRREPKLTDRYRVGYRDIAALGVHTINNFLFGGGAYDSGDEARKITPGDANVYSEQIRAFYMPGVKGKAKWLKGVPEDFGGQLGRWMRENIEENRDNFANDVRANRLGYMPTRLYFSLQDHERFETNPDDPRWYDGLSLAQAVMTADIVDIGDGLLDFADGADALDFSRVGSAGNTEWIGDYADTRGSAIKIYKHLTSDKPEDRLKNDALIGALIKCRKDPLTADIYRNEDMIVAAVALGASPTGMLLGTSEILLNLPNTSYDRAVTGYLSDTRLVDGMPGGTIDRIYQRLNANNTNTLAGNLKHIPIIGLALDPDTFLNRRSQIRREAASNMARKNG